MIIEETTHLLPVDCEPEVGKRHSLGFPISWLDSRIIENHYSKLSEESESSLHDF